MSNYDSIIFDLDGTLWNSTETIFGIWQVVLKNNPQINKTITIKDLEGCMGLLKDEIAEKLFPSKDFSKEIRDDLMDQAEKLEYEHLKKFGAKNYPNVIETLEYLSKKYKLFIVSNCQDGYIQSFLELNNAHNLITDFECPGRTNLPKGENIKLIMERNNLKSPIYVGDTLKDFDACKFAEIPFIFAEYGFGNVPSYDYKIETIEELRNIF